jgi:hypothetical protein
MRASGLEGTVFKWKIPLKCSRLGGWDGCSGASNLAKACVHVAKRSGGGAPPPVAFLVGLEGSGHHLVDSVVRGG